MYNIIVKTLNKTKYKYQIILKEFAPNQIVLSKEIVFITKPYTENNKWESIQLVLHNDYSLFQKLHTHIKNQIESYDNQIKPKTFSIFVHVYDLNQHVIDSWIILNCVIESISYRDGLMLLIINYNDVIFH